MLSIVDKYVVKLTRNNQSFFLVLIIMKRTDVHWDVDAVRKKFPLYKEHPMLAYLDNAATTQKPEVVIKRLIRFYSTENANIHRGIYDLSNAATHEFEEVRKKAALFLGSDNPLQIAFTAGTTDSINTVAQSFLKNRLEERDNIIVSIMEHHANFIPWQQLCKESKASLRVIPIDKHGGLDLAQFKQMLDSKTRLVSVTHISNTLGTTNEIEEITDMAHSMNIPVMIDAAQSAALYDLNCRTLSYDFLAFSGHKLFGPFGTGVLYVSENYMAEMKPYRFGGGIIKEASLIDTRFSAFPYNQNPGTPDVAGIISMGTALKFINTLDKTKARAHISILTQHAIESLKSINGVKVYGGGKKQVGIISFNVKDIHPHDVASFLNKDNISVRAGMHCTQPLLKHLNLNGTVRISFSIYNSLEEVDRLKNSLQELIKFWK